MELESYVLRFSPVTMPLVAFCAALAGLMGAGGIPDLENMAFVAYATLFSGFAPACALVGILFYVADFHGTRYRPLLLVAQSIVNGLILICGYWYGIVLGF